MFVSLKYTCTYAHVLMKLSIKWNERFWIIQVKKTASI